MSGLGTDAKMWGKGFGLSRLLWLISALGVVGFLQYDRLCDSRRNGNIAHIQ